MSDTAKYAPPPIPPYPETLEALRRTLAPYTQEDRPIELFFELFIVDVLGALPRTTDQAISAFAAQFPWTFAESPDWRAGLKQVLHLSDTIEIAILDLWYRNRRNAAAQGWTYHPWHYAMNFVTEYYAEESQVDVWEGEALEAARRRIAAEQQHN